MKKGSPDDSVYKLSAGGYGPRLVSAAFGLDGDARKLYLTFRYIPCCKLVVSQSYCIALEL